MSQHYATHHHVGLSVPKMGRGRRHPGEFRPQPQIGAHLGDLQEEKQEMGVWEKERGTGRDVEVFREVDPLRDGQLQRSI